MDATVSIPDARFSLTFYLIDSGLSGTAGFKGPAVREARGVEWPDDLSALRSPARPLGVSGQESPSQELAPAPQGETRLQINEDLGFDARGALNRESIVTLSDESFSMTLDGFRDEFQRPSVRPAPEAKEAPDPQVEIDEEEERMTQYYRQVLDALIRSKTVTEDTASIAQGKRGRELAAAVGLIISMASSRTKEVSTLS